MLVDSQQAEGYPKQDGYVRMPYLHNTFRLVPLKGNWTRVEFETQIDLGGSAPCLAGQRGSTEAPLVTLEGMQKQMTQTRYQIKSANELPTYFFKGRSLTLPKGIWHPSLCRR